MKMHKMAALAVLLACAIVLQLLEPQLPLPVLGVRLGLANIIGIIALKKYGWKSMVGINLLRVLLSSLLRGTIMGVGFWLSLSGTLLSTISVIIANRFTKLSMAGLGILSSAVHCLGQMLAVCAIWSSFYLIGYLPVMWLLSIPTGFLTGWLASRVLKLIH